MFATMTKEEVLDALTKMQDDPTMLTADAYSPNTTLWPDNRIPFADIHLAYLATHKNVDPRNYLSNLRLMIKNRT